MFRAAFPDWHSEIGILVGEGDLVVEHFTASGTQQGEILGVPASDRTVDLPATQLSSLLLSAHGLTTAQSRVVAQVIRGHSTRQIVRELHISANTVQEHLTAAFDKLGVRSRRELVAAVLTGRH